MVTRFASAPCSSSFWKLSLIACCFGLSGTACTSYVVQLELDRTAGTRPVPEITLGEPDIDDVRFDTAPLRARSNDGPGLLAVPAAGSATLGTLYLTWSGRGNDRRMWLMRKNGYGTWQSRQQVNDTDRSDHSPSLAQLNGKLYIAWTGTDSEHHINVMESADGGVTWTNKVTFRDEPRRARSDDAPFLFSDGRALFLVWSGRGSNRHMFIMENDGSGWDPKRTVNSVDSSDHTPSLAYFNERFYIAWTGRDSERHVNVMSSRTGRFWSGKRTFTTEPIRARSDDGPKLRVVGDELYLVFSGRGSARHVFTMATRDGATWLPKISQTPASEFTPDIAQHADRVFLAWADLTGERYIHATEKTMPTDLVRLYARDGSVVLRVDAAQTGLPIPSANPTLPCSNALDPWELRDFEEQYRSVQRDRRTRLFTFGKLSWRTITNYVYGFVVDRRVMWSGACEQVGGILYSAITDQGRPRTAFAVTRFANSSDDVTYFLSVAHELGHSFNLHHTDGEIGTRIMCGGLNPYMPMNENLLTFSQSSKHHLRNDPRTCSRPGPGRFDSVAPGHPSFSNTNYCGPHSVEYICE